MRTLLIVCLAALVTTCMGVTPSHDVKIEEKGKKNFNNQSAIYGTWTLQTHTTSDFGYYKGSAFLVMHVMADPLQTYRCSLPKCNEYVNHICVEGNECANMASTIVEWSDVSVFYQYGFELESGTYPWRNHLVHNTSGWLGPYNLVLPIHNDHEIHGRYVTTAATDYLKRPVNDSLFDPATLFDQLAGATAVHSTILRQAEKSIYSHPRQDPFVDYKGTCEPASEDHRETNHHGIKPMLPRFVVSHQNMVLEYQLWSLPEASDKNSLYKVWPTFQKHLPDFPVVGPYCYEGDPQRAYAINVTYDTRRKENNSWTLTDGCVFGLPCWPSDPNPDRPHGGGGPDDPDDDNGGGTPQTIYRWLKTYGAYVLLLALVISLTLNCQLSFRLQQQHRRQPTTWGEEGEGDLEEPLLLLPSIEVTTAEAPANPAAEVSPMVEDDGTGDPTNSTN